MTYPNPEQRQILRHLHGTLLVLTPAGTGKTRLMADRLAAVIATGMPPEVILGVTFTNRAAEHMRGAVLESCGPAAKHCRIQTFHSLCAWMLRLESRDLGLPSDFVIYDEQDSIDLMRECRKAPDISPDSLFQQLSQMKSDCAEQELTLASIPTVHPSKGFEFVTVIIAQLRVSLCALRNSAFRFIPSSKPHRPGSASPLRPSRLCGSNPSQDWST